MPYPASGLPNDMFTSDARGLRRLRTDQGQTGFFENREFRFEREISEPIVFKFSSPINFILQLQTFASHNGEAVFAAYASTQGAEGDPFGDVIPPNPNNAMTNAPEYTPQIVISKGGTFTPNNIDPNFAREYVKVIASTATAQRSTVGGGGVKERGLPAGDYYLTFTGVDASYRLIYEERP